MKKYMYMKLITSLAIISCAPSDPSTKISAGSQTEKKIAVSILPATPKFTIESKVDGTSAKEFKFTSFEQKEGPAAIPGQVNTKGEYILGIGTNKDSLPQFEIKLSAQDCNITTASEFIMGKEASYSCPAAKVEVDSITPVATTASLDAFKKDCSDAGADFDDIVKTCTSSSEKFGNVTFTFGQQTTDFSEISLLKIFRELQNSCPKLASSNVSCECGMSIKNLWSEAKTFKDEKKIVPANFCSGETTITTSIETATPKLPSLTHYAINQKICSFFIEKEIASRNADQRCYKSSYDTLGVLLSEPHKDFVSKFIEIENIGVNLGTCSKMKLDSHNKDPFGCRCPSVGLKIYPFGSEQELYYIIKCIAGEQ